MMKTVIERIKEVRIIPIASVDSAEEALKISEALMRGGLNAIEITFRTRGAESAIKKISENFPEMFVGAGTILNAGDLGRARDAGAKFAVSPGLNPLLVSAASELQFPFFPGVMTPSEIERGLELGVKCFKFFPAETAGGVKMIKSLMGPYGHLGISFIATGGVTEKNLELYLGTSGVIAVGGSWMLDKILIKNKEWGKIRDLTKEALALAKKKICG
jgi:2-dehydro-3-deoxyphosphogluconate aldolase/(4S)-4-hydroxy-2-oxoglutarate aldolase